VSRARQLALAGTVLLVLVLVGSLVAGLGGDRPEEDASPASSAAAPRPARVRVEVLNAAGIPGLARTVTDRLRDRGFDVVYFGNGRGFSPDTSLVLDRATHPDAARQVAAALGIRRVLSRPDSTLYLDVTVVLGKDLKGEG
jgi:hypothetical protein